MITAKITPAQYEELADKLMSQEGINLVGNSGKLSKDGITAAYNFDGSTLTIELLHTPFLVPKSLCESKIREALAAQGCAAE